MKVLNDAEHAHWYGYIRGIADQLRLRDWDIELHRDAAEGDVDAHIVVTYGRRIASIAFGDSFWGNSPEKQRTVCVHEVLHIYLDDIDTIIRDAEDVWGSESAAFKLMSLTIKNRIELATDSLGESLAPFFPLPEVAA